MIQVSLSHERALVSDGSQSYVKKLVILNTNMEGLTNYKIEERPWGNFERFTLNEKTTVKIITVNAGESISLQTHENRDEF